MTKRHGAIASQRLDNYTATVAPAVTDDINSGYDVGSVWISTTTNDVWVCVKSTAGVAVWRLMTVPPPAGGGGTADTVSTILPLRLPQSQRAQGITPSTTLAIVFLTMVYETFTATRMSIQIFTPRASTQVRVVLYDLVGTLLLDQTFASTAGGVVSTSISALTLTPGYYYVLVCRSDAVGGLDPVIQSTRGWEFAPMGPPSGSFNVWAGTVVIVGGAAPNPLDPTAITGTLENMAIVRFD